MIVIVLLGVVIAPFLIDWTAYRADFEREAGRILGRPVTVRGEASARILPFPSVTFTDVVVGGDTPDAPPLMTVAGFRMDAELAPYLSGEIRIFSMTLDRPALRLPLTSAGTLAFTGEGATLPTSATVILEDVEIVDGSVAVENGLTGRSHMLSDITARMSAKSLSGPYAGTGTLSSAGRRFAFALSSGGVQDGNALPLKLTVDAPALDAGFVLDGIAKASGPGAGGQGPGFAGTIKVTSPLPKPAGRDPSSPAQAAVLPPFTLAGTVNATPREIAVADMRVAAGEGKTPYILTGSGSLGLSRLPRFSLDLEGEQVNVDEIAAGSEVVAPAAPMTFARRLEAARQVFSALPRPSIPGTVKIALPVVVAGDTTVRDVGFTVLPTDSGWSVARFAAELPGRTRMEASGVVSLDDTLGFKGDLLVASRQPSGFASWLTGAVDPAIRALTQAGFSATVDLSAERQVFEELEANVGGDVLRGRLERSGPALGHRIDADLTAGGIDLDALLALSRLFTAEGDGLTDADRLALKIAAGPVTYSGAEARRIDADVTFDGERLGIAKLAVEDLAGADVTMAGELGRLQADVSGRLSVGMTAERPERFIAFLKDRLPPSPAIDALLARGPSLGPLALKGEVRTKEETPGERPTLKAKLGGTAAKTAIGLTLELGNGIYASGTSGRFGLGLTLSNETPSVLLGQLGLDMLPTPVPGPLSAELSLSAAASGPVAASAAMRAPGSELTAEGTFDLGTAGISGAEFGLSARSQDLSPWLLATGTGLSALQSAALPTTLQGQLTLADGDLTLDGISGTVGTRSVSATLERHAGAPLGGDVFVSDLSLPWLATLVYGLSPDGESWPTETFGASILPKADIAIGLTADRLTLADGTDVADFSSVLALSEGELELSEIKGAVAGGYVSGSASFSNANGVGGATLDLGLSGIDLGALALGPEPDTGDDAGPDPAIAGSLDGDVTLEGSGQSYAGLVATLTGAITARIEDGSFVGLRTGLLPDLLKAADGEGFVPSDAAVAPVVAALSAAERYPVPALALDAAVTAGVARFAAVTLTQPGETLTASGSLDLRDGTVGSDLRLDLDAGDEAVEGAAPSILYRLSGPLNSPSLVPDVQPLTSFLSVRAFEREQARVEALQEQLQERLRLRREARYARWKEVARQDAERAAAFSEAAESIRLERLRAESGREAAARAAAVLAEQAAERAAMAAAEAAEAARREAAAEAERARVRDEAIEAERRRAADAAAEAAIRAARAARQAAPAPTPAPAQTSTPPAAAPAPRALENPVAPTPPAPRRDYPSLPGVENPLNF